MKKADAIETVERRERRRAGEPERDVLALIMEERDRLLLQIRLLAERKNGIEIGRQVLQEICDEEDEQERRSIKLLARLGYRYQPAHKGTVI